LSNYEALKLKIACIRSKFQIAAKNIEKREMKNFLQFSKFSTSFSTYQAPNCL